MEKPSIFFYNIFINHLTKDVYILINSLTQIISTANFKGILAFYLVMSVL